MFHRDIACSTWKLLAADRWVLWKDMRSEKVSKIRFFPIHRLSDNSLSVCRQVFAACSVLAFSAHEAFWERVCRLQPSSHWYSFNPTTSKAIRLVGRFNSNDCSLAPGDINYWIIYVALFLLLLGKWFYFLFNLSLCIRPIFSCYMDQRWVEPKR